MSAWLYFFQQSLCAWSLLLALGFCVGMRKPAFLRLTASALLSGGASLVCAVFPRLFLRLAFLGLITLLAPAGAWPGLPQGQRRAMVFPALGLALLMAGGAHLLEDAGLGGTLLNILLSALLPAIALRRPDRPGARCVTLEVIHHAHRLELTALVDSGNLLRDPLTRLPVIVVSRKAAARLVSLPERDGIAPGMRLISVRTVAGTSLMAIFRPGSIRILESGGWQPVRALVGVNPDGYNGFQALVPSSVISPAQGGMPPCP